jgi:hypothetical protein
MPTPPSPSSNFRSYGNLIYVDSRTEKIYSPRRAGIFPMCLCAAEGYRPQVAYFDFGSSLLWKVSNIDHYFSAFAHANIALSPLRRSLSVTESAACSRLIQTGKEEPMLRSRSHPQTLAEQKARLEKRHPS